MRRPAAGSGASLVSAGIRGLVASVFAWSLVVAGYADTAAPEENGEEKATEARMNVRGYGFFGNRLLMRNLQILQPNDEPPPYYTANQVEDAVFILVARMQEDGYLRPEVEAEIVDHTGGRNTYSWDDSLETRVPRPLRAVEVRYRVDPGVLYYYNSLEFDGLTVIDESEAEEYFIATGFLLRTRAARVFTPEGFESGLGNLREVLVRRGYERATVVAGELARDDESGEVDVKVDVNEGPQSLVRSARVELIDHAEDGEDVGVPVPEGEPYSRIWTQDAAQQVRNRFYRRGYPDTQVRIEVEDRERENDTVWVDLVLRVEPGPYVEVGDIVFHGDDRTKESVMRRRVEIPRGEPLDRTEIDSARFRLARLGVFESVEVELEEVDENTRNVVFTLEEGKRVDMSLLLGYGSYEMLRGGIEVEQYNLFGRAHRSRLLLTQSFKATSGNYTYTVPELFGERVHGFSQVFGLRRDEVSFDRREYGASVGLQRFFRQIDTDATLRYTFQRVQSRQLAGVEEDGLFDANIAAIGVEARRDRRDNPIYPERGDLIFGQSESAAHVLGGDVSYQRGELGAFYHRGIGGGRFIHIGARHGAVYTLRTTREDLPFNRRFFLGGENTVRGFVQGEASPRNEEGDIIGSETYLLVNLEIEQALTPQWSVVAFSDSIGFARSLRDYPYDQTLFSLGIGVRYKTIIGPLRLEYGRNLNPREQDPSGALHLSIGFPF